MWAALQRLLPRSSSDIIQRDTGEGSPPSFEREHLMYYAWLLLLRTHGHRMTRAIYLENTKQVSTRTLVCDFQSAMVTNPGAMWIFCNDHCCVAFIDAMGRISSKQVHCCQLAGRLNDAFHWCPPGANLKPRPPLSKSIFLAKGFSRLSEVASDLPPGPTPPS